MYPGNITVGEVLQGFENITSQPQVPVTVVPALDAEAQHWQVLLDEDGIIGPDGQPILIQTGVQSTPNQNQLTAVFDTGFSFPQVPLCVKKHVYISFRLCSCRRRRPLYLQPHSFVQKGRCPTRYILVSPVHRYNSWMVLARYGSYLAMLKLISLSKLVAKRILCTRWIQIPTTRWQILMARLASAQYVWSSPHASCPKPPIPVPTYLYRRVLNL